MADLLTPALRSELKTLRELVRQIAAGTDAEYGRQMAREHLVLPPDPDRNTLRCSFCGWTQHKVGVLIIGHRVGICDDCVACCTDILTERQDAALDEIRRLGT